MSQIDFHFDVMCPYAFQTSLWIREVARLSDLEVTWRFFSLEEVNRAEGKKHPWEREWSYGWSMMRVGAALRRIDSALIDEWYLRAATALHVDGLKPHRREVAEHLVTEMGLDPALVGQAIEDPSTSDEVLADHERVLELGGFGVPTLVRDGQALFGPVLIDPPMGDDALRLFEAISAWFDFPHVYELQRPKRPADIEAIATTFAPYFSARDWITIQRDTP